MKLYNPLIYKLCYADGMTLWFHKDPIEKVWGDDWNDSPFEHNAGEPYYESETDVAILHIISRSTNDGTPIHSAIDMTNCYGSGTSVESINKGEIPWLSFGFYNEKPRKAFFGGSTLEEVIDTLEAHGVRYALDNVTLDSIERNIYT